MGKPSSSDDDITTAKVEKTFTATGNSDPVRIDPRRKFNVSMAFGSGTVQLQRSFDGGTTWKVISSKTADFEEVREEPEDGMLYRFECTAYTSGNIICRLSQ